VSGSGAPAIPEGARIPSAADVFSLGVLAHDLLAGRPLLPPGCGVGEYRSRVGALAGADVSRVPAPLQVRARGAGRRGAEGGQGAARGSHPI
jgi:hypothetical protein